MAKPSEHKILLLDDDPDVVELYREILGSLPSKPEIFTATSGARAIAMLESGNFTLLVSDLHMPKMDGLQVLSIVRRRFPQLRTAVLTSVADQHFRSRAYAMGIDLFLEKPNGSHEIRFMLDCIESLLGRNESQGFRGVQNKSLVDIVQLECLSQTSSLLRITHGTAEGFIWIRSGEVIDAATGNLGAEEAFKKILSWRTGNFEMLPEDPRREQTIFTSYQGLLLETAQSLDESDAPAATPGEEQPQGAAPANVLHELGRLPGVEYIVTSDGKEGKPLDAWGCEAPEKVAKWTRETLSGLQAIGQILNAGNLTAAEGFGPSGHAAWIPRSGANLCAGFSRSLSREQVHEITGKITAQWAS